MILSSCQTHSVRCIADVGGLQGCRATGHLVDSPCRTGILLRTRAPHHATHIIFWGVNPLFAVVRVEGATGHPHPCWAGHPLRTLRPCTASGGAHPRATCTARVQPKPVRTLSPYVSQALCLSSSPPPPCATAGAAERDNRNLNTKDPMTLAIFVAGSPLMPPRPRIAWPGPIDPH